MMSTIEGVKYTGGRMTRPKACVGDAWELLVEFFFSQRASLPPLAAELELSPAQVHVLHLIEPGQPMPMGRLAETLACDASNVTGLVDRLVSEGAISRTRQKSDRRSHIVSLTDKGRRQFSKMAKAHESWIARMFADLSQSEFAALTKLLGKLKTSVRSATSQD